MTVFAQKHAVKITPTVHTLLKILSAHTKQPIVRLANDILIDELIERISLTPELKNILIEYHF